MLEAERYSVLIVPEDAEGRVRRYEVSGHVIKGAIALGVLLITGLLAGVAGVTVGLKASAHSAELQAQNEAYERQLSRAMSMAETLGAQLEELKATEARLRKLYNYDDHPATAEDPGQEPPSHTSMSPSPGSPAMMGIGGKGGVEGGQADKLSPGFDLYLSDVPGAPEEELDAPAFEPASDPLTVAFLSLGSEISAARSSISDLEQHLAEQADALRHIPSIRPVSSGWVSSGFGVRTSPFTGIETFHDGLDIVANIGDPVVATADGVVTYASYANGFGLLVEIDHGDGIRTRYGHNQRTLVRVGQKVRRGQKISRVGMTGNTTGPHVHYEVLKDGRQVDPRGYLADE